MKLYGQDTNDRTAMLKQADKALAHLLPRDNEQEYRDARGGYLNGIGYRGPAGDGTSERWHYGAHLARVHKNTHNAYLALQHAAEQIGQRSAEASAAAHVKAGRSIKTWQYRPTPEHLAITDALLNLCTGALSPEDAMSLLHVPAIHAARFGKEEPTCRRTSNNSLACGTA